MRKLLFGWLVVSMLFFIATATAALAFAAGEQPADQGVEAMRYARVVTEKGTLNLRSSAKDSAKILGRIPKGAIVRIVEDGDNWTKVLYGGLTGFVKTGFLEEITELPYPLLTKDVKGEAVLAFKQALYRLGYLKSDDINQRFDKAMEIALTKVQLMNGVALDPQAVTPELQALMAWGMLVKGKSGYVGTGADAASGLQVAIFCWDSDGILYDADRSVKIKISFAVQASGGQPPYAVTVKKSLGGEQSGDVVASPFSYIWGPSTDVLNVFATVVDAAGNTATACAPFSYALPAQYRDDQK